jgi:hypothetical protein
MSTVRFSPAQEELRAIAFAASSESIPGAKFLTGWDIHAPRASGFGRRTSYLTADRTSSPAPYADDNAGWVSVPSQRIVKRRERRSANHKARESASAWLGRTDGAEVPVGTALVSTGGAPRAFWVPKKDGSHALEVRYY